MTDNALSYYRWSDNQKRIGKSIIYSKDDNRDSELRRIFHLGIESRGGLAYARKGNRLRLSMLGWTFIFALPTILKPYKRWVDTSHYVWSDNPKGGYWDTHRTEYSISIFPDSLHLHYGPQTHDSETDKSKCWFYPWKDFRCVRHSLYDLRGNLFVDLPLSKPGYSYRWETEQALEATCPKKVYEFQDFDGELIEATCTLKEYERSYGSGYFKWISWFKKNRKRRYLDLKFSKEVGKRKKTWKGGTVGHSIDTLPNELHEDAFKRYCEQNNLTFIGEYNANPA